MTGPRVENQDQPEDQPVIPGNDEGEEAKLPEWHSVLFESNQKLQREREERERLQREVEDLRSSRNNPPPRVEEAPIDVINDPTGFRERLNADMRAQTEPLNSFVDEQRKEKLYFRLRNELAQEDPKMGMALQSLYQHVDNHFLANLNNLNITKQTIRQHIVYLIGEFALVASEQNNNNNNRPVDDRRGPPPVNQNRQNPKRDEMLPPHIRPSNRSRNQGNNNNDQEPELDENERKLARDSKMTPSEYVRLRDTPHHLAEKVYAEILADRKKGGQ